MDEAKRVTEAARQRWQGLEADERNRPAAAYKTDKAQF